VVVVVVMVVGYVIVPRRLVLILMVLLVLVLAERIDIKRHAERIFYVYQRRMTHRWTGQL